MFKIGDWVIAVRQTPGQIIAIEADIAFVEYESVTGKHLIPLNTSQLIAAEPPAPKGAYMGISVEEDMLDDFEDENDPMSPEEFAIQMREAYETHWMKAGDEEAVHIVMDGIMCNILRQLGYGEGIDIFDSTPMWYA